MQSKAAGSERGVCRPSDQIGAFPIAVLRGPRPRDIAEEEVEPPSVLRVSPQVHAFNTGSLPFANVGIVQDRESRWIRAAGELPNPLRTDEGGNCYRSRRDRRGGAHPVDATGHRLCHKAVQWQELASWENVCMLPASGGANQSS
jgi:hypothetical protein